jgi:hypothetical protein
VELPTLRCFFTGIGNTKADKTKVALAKKLLAPELRRYWNLTFPPDDNLTEKPVGNDQPALLISFISTTEPPGGGNKTWETYQKTYARLYWLNIARNLILAPLGLNVSKLKDVQTGSGKQLERVFFSKPVDFEIQTVLDMLRNISTT